MAEEKTSFEEKARAWITPVLMSVATFFIVQVYYSVQDLQNNMQLLLIKEAATNQRIENLEEKLRRLEKENDRLNTELEQLYRNLKL